MCKLILNLLCLLLISSTLSATTVKCSKQLTEMVTTILKLPEAKALMETIQKEGPISIEANRSRVMGQFGAYWDPDRRLIAVNMAGAQSRGDIIGSIIFEMHNALVNQEINRLYNLAREGKIKRAAYVEAMEYLEYQNSLKASKMADSGIKKGIYPHTSRLYTYNTFHQHFRVQQMTGHSDFFAKIYDEAAPRGRW